MKGLWLEKGNLALREDLARPVAGDGELLLRVRAAGICGTDFELMNGYAGFTGIPGHEFVGEILEGPAERVGERVVASINIGCGTCDNCARGLENHCRERRVIGIRGRNGAFADRVSVPRGNAHRLPAAIGENEGVLVEPLAAALEIAEQYAFEGGERVLVVGAGRLAQLVVQVASQLAGRVSVLMRSEARRGAFAPLDVECLEAPGGDYDLVVECSGAPEGLDVALAAVRARGTVILKSTLAGGASPRLNELVVNEITLLGSRCGPFETAIEWLAAGRIRTDHLRFERFALDDWSRAFDASRDPAVYKTIFVPESP